MGPNGPILLNGEPYIVAVLQKERKQKNSMAMVGLNKPIRFILKLY